MQVQSVENDGSSAYLDWKFIKNIYFMIKSIVYSHTFSILMYITNNTILLRSCTNKAWKIIALSIGYSSHRHSDNVTSINLTCISIRTMISVNSTSFMIQIVQKIYIKPFHCFNKPINLNKTVWCSSIWNTLHHYYNCLSSHPVVSITSITNTGIPALLPRRYYLT